MQMCESLKQMETQLLFETQLKRRSMLIVKKGNWNVLRIAIVFGKLCLLRNASATQFVFERLY